MANSAGQVRLTRGPGHDLGPERVGVVQGHGERGADADRPGVGPVEAEGQEPHHQPVQGHGLGDEQHQAGQVIPPRDEAPGRVLRLQEHPGQRLVDAQMEGGPGPAEVRPAQAPIVEVVEEIDVVVPADEAVPQGGRGRDQCGQRGQQRDRPRAATRGGPGGRRPRDRPRGRGPSGGARPPRFRVISHDDGSHHGPGSWPGTLARPGSPGRACGSPIVMGHPGIPRPRGTVSTPPDRSGLVPVGRGWDDPGGTVAGDLLPSAVFTALAFLQGRGHNR